MKLTKNFIQPIAGAMLCIFLFSCGGKNAQNGGGMVREYAVMTLQPDSMSGIAITLLQLRVSGILRYVRMLVALLQI